jgi:hypothetical protein
MRVEGGAAGYVDIVARLLSATFAAKPGDGSDETKEGGAAGPFPGTR